MSGKSILALAVLVVVVLIGSTSLFTVNEKEQVVLFALG